MKPGWIPKVHDQEMNLEPEYVPGPSVVAKRALCLLTVQLRCMVEHLFAEEGLENSRRLWGQFSASFEAIDIHDELLPDEASLLETEIGQCDPTTLATTSWDVESLGVLLWALGLLEALPSFDEKFDIDALLEASPSGTPASRQFIADAKLRPSDELEREEWRSYHWLWRIRAMPHAGKNLLSPSARDANLHHHETYPDDPMADGDLVAFGKPVYRLRLDSEDLGTLRALVELRAHALRWLTSGGDWEDVPMDT